MKILIRQALIADPDSPFHQQAQDILIENGIITQIGQSLPDTDAQIINHDTLCVSPGWTDAFTDFADPGQEFRETIATGTAAAAAGGYTTVLLVPNTQPAVQNKTQVEYIIHQSKHLPCEALPMGAITKNIEGKELAEMYDMRMSGAAAFTDGHKPVQTAGLLLKAMQYVKAFDGVVVQVPDDTSIGTHGLMHEGIISTQLGLPGKPMLAEEIIVARDIALLKYTQSRLHISGISSPAAVELVKAAKAEGLQVTCAVTPYHLLFCDEDVQGYHTSLKVNPPLRTKADMLYLREAVKAGHIDAIASHHLPQDWDHKTCEFEYAKNGMITLQTAFAMVLESIPDLSPEQISRIFSSNTRNIFRLPATNIAVGAKANLTLFSTNNSTTLTTANNLSRSANSAVLNRTLKGKVIGTIRNTFYHFNP